MKMTSLQRSMAETATDFVLCRRNHNSGKRNVLRDYAQSLTFCPLDRRLECVLWFFSTSSNNFSKARRSKDISKTCAAHCHGNIITLWFMLRTVCKQAVHWNKHSVLTLHSEGLSYTFDQRISIKRSSSQDKESVIFRDVRNDAISHQSRNSEWVEFFYWKSVRSYKVRTYWKRAVIETNHCKSCK